MSQLTKLIAGAARGASIVASLAAALAPGFAQAQGTIGGGGSARCTAPPGGNPNPNNNCSASSASPAARGSGGPDVGAGNPIHLLSGNKYQLEVDLPALPGVLGIELVRHYNSLDAHRGLTGANWRTSYETVLYDFGRNLQIVQADGRRLMFERPTPASSQKATAASTLAHELCTAADPNDGQVTVEYDAKQQPIYHWRWPDGRVLTFGWGTAGGHPLHSITAASGERLVLAYAPTGELLRITDPQGRSLTLNYDRQRRLQDIATPLGTVRYQRDAQYRLIDVQMIDAQTGSNAQGGATRRYHYESERQSNHANALTGISLVSTDALGRLSEQRLSTYAYDARGRAILSTKGQPKQTKNGQPMADTGIEQVDVDYKEPALPNRAKMRDGITEPSQLGTTILTNSLGQKSQLKTAVIGGNFRLIEFTGPGCSTCPEPNKRYAYNVRGQLVREYTLDARGNIQAARHYEYDAQGRTVREGEQASAATPARWTQRLEYNDQRFPQHATLITRPSVIEGKEHQTRIAYNDQGQVTQISDSGFSPVDANGRPSPQGTSIQRTTTYAYTKVQGKSVLASIDGPLLNGPKQSPEDSDITRIEWNDKGTQITSVTAPMNLATRYERDGAGRLLRTIAGNGSVNHWHYRADQPLRPSATARAGMAVGYAYDALGRAAAIADASGRYITLQYDAAGRLTTVRDAQGYAQKLQLDVEGKPLAAGLYEPGQNQPLRAAYRLYDEQQRLKSSVLPDGRISTWHYDDSAQGQGQLIEHVDGDDVMHLWRRSGTQGVSAQIDLTPDGFVRASLRSLRAAAYTRNTAAPTQVTDDFGRIVAQHTPDHGSRFSVYDAANRFVLSRQLGTDAKLASTTEQDHDAAGRMTERRTLDPNGSVIDRVRWQWEGAQLRQVDDMAQTQDFERDSAGRAVQTIVTLKTAEGKPLPPITLRTTYDPLTGEPKVHTLADQRELRIERDARTGVAHQLTLVSPAQWWQVWKLQWSLRAAMNGELQDHAVLKDIAAHPFNGVTGWRHGNGVSTVKQFDVAGRLTQLNVGANGNAIAAQTLAYKTGPRVRGITNMAAPQGALQETAFDYDGFGRLKTGAENSKPTLQRTALNTTTGASTQPAVQQTMEYDRLGRIAIDGSRRYIYDAHGQLSQVHEQDRLVASYRYNHLGQRVSKTVHANGKSNATYFLWHQQRLVAELCENGQDEFRIDAQYLYLKDGNKAATPIAKLEAGTASGNRSGRVRLLAVHADHRGQPVAMSDEQQHVVWRNPATAQVNAWGYTTTATDAGSLAQAAEMNVNLPGQYRDAETGLHDNWHRTYNPQTGRYLQPDPLGYPDGPDPYLYAGGDPVNRVDSLGLYSEDVHFYMTFFLARLGGISYDEALTIALATQFVDDNRRTQPIPTSALAVASTSPIADHNNRLRLYHFMEGLTNSSGVANPSSDQLSNLFNAGARAPTRCARAQFFGEFLHTFEDTFSHRAQDDTPIGINIGPVTWGPITINGVGRGHLEWGTSPDRTFNHVVATPDDPRFTRQVGNWSNNEARTLRMEQEVFDQLGSYSGRAWINSATGQRIVDSSTGRAVAQRDVFGDGTASGSGFMQQWNRMRSEDDKIFFLNDLLARFSLGALPTYSVSDAARNRNNYLCGLDAGAYPGVILPTRSSPGRPCS